MKTEMNALKKNCTWEIVDLPKGNNIVGCKWVYSIKYKKKLRLIDIKPSLLLRDTHKFMGLISSRLFHLKNIFLLICHQAT